MTLVRRNLLAASATACGLLLLVAGRADAQVAQSFAELNVLGLLNPGDKITVRDSSGYETKGVFREFRSGSLVLLVSEPTVERAFAEQEVQRIRRGGGTATGWGAVVGTGVAFLITVAAAASYGENEGGELCGACLAQWSAVAVPVGGGIGAGIGLAIDRARRKTFYLAPDQVRSVLIVPLLSHRGARVLVSARF